jgi:UTP--glucose-1-phosphate uridylyltransferase
MRHGTPVVATRPVAPDETRRYGILDIDRSWTDPDNAAVRARGLVEKPDPERAPSLYGVYGRYVLPATIFEFIDRTPPDKSGEIQITDALNLYCESDPVYGAFFAGNHYDTGNWKGYAEATMACFANELGIEQNSPLQSYH